jgi:hypothetical protein
MFIDSVLLYLAEYGGSGCSQMCSWQDRKVLDLMNLSCSLNPECGSLTIHNLSSHISIVVSTVPMSINLMDAVKSEGKGHKRE